MKERILMLLDLEQLTPSKFADIIGVQRSSVSHIISGRNKPSYDFLHKTLKAFPGLNASWLMLGEGSMYEQMRRKVSKGLFDTAVDQSEQVNQAENVEGDEGSGHILHSQTASEEVSDDNQPAESTEEPGPAVISGSRNIKPSHETAAEKKVVQVMVFYADDTFRTYSPDQ